MKYSKFIVIPSDVFLSTKITQAQKILYGHISALSNHKGYCWATNGFFAKMMDASERSISRDIAALNECGFITSMVVKNPTGTVRVLSIPQSSYTPEKNAIINPEGVDSGDEPGSQNCLPRTPNLAENTDPVLISINNQLEYREEADGLTENTKPKQNGFSEFILQFNTIRGKSFRGDSKSEAHFKARIKGGYTIEQMITALKNAMKDEFHIESNFKYLTPEFLTREDKLDKFLNFTPAPNPNQPYFKSNAV